MIVSPVTARPVYFDDCFRDTGDLVDGDMKKGDLVDAKGEEYEHLLSIDGVGDSVMGKLLGRARQQTNVTNAMGRGLKWYFAEKGAADTVRERFQREGYGNITIAVLPPSRPK